MKLIKKSILLLALAGGTFLSGGKAYAQQTVVDVRVDSAAILIGEQTVLHLTVTTDKDKAVQLVIPRDTLTAGVEVLERLNNKIMQKLGYSRAELFIQLDKPALKPLPEASYSYTLVKKVRVHADYHVEIDKHYYSVPCSLLGQQLEAWISGELVRLFNQGQEVAVHPRKRTYGYSTRNEHMPEAHRQHATWTPERLLEWAGHIGSETHSYVLHILNSRPHPEQSYRFCLGLLNLHKKYSKARLNAACARALKTKVWRLSGIKSILEKGLDKQPVQDPKPDLLSTMEHENVRGSEYYH